MAILCGVFIKRFLVMNFSNGDYSSSVARCLTIHNWTLNCAALTRSIENGRPNHRASERTYREHRLYRLLYSVTSLRRLRVLHSNGCCLESHLLATGLFATLLKRIFNKLLGKCELDSSCSRLWKRNEPLSCIQCWKFLQWLSNYTR
jgi:hypothetical protein